MTQTHLDHILERFPEFSSRARLLREQAGFGEQDVADPMGGSEEDFARCLDMLKESIEALLRSDFKDPS